jgi:Outer membrane protein beta-barrel domain
MEEKQMMLRHLVLGTTLLCGLAAWSQEFPRAEVGLDYSYARYAPSAPYSKGHSLNGGGGSLVFNLNEYIGIKMDLQGYGSNHTKFNIAPNSQFPFGLQGDVQGNLFTYLFGPQIKVRAHGVQPFVDLLFGGAHSNVYTDAFRSLCPNLGVCSFSSKPASDAFAMAFGGGIDIPLGHVVSFRPAEIDYLLTRFSNPFTGTNNQNNLRYQVGVVFNLHNTTY